MLVVGGGIPPLQPPVSCGAAGSFEVGDDGKKLRRLLARPRLMVLGCRCGLSLAPQ